MGDKTQAATCRACSECDGNHHFGDSTIRFAESEPEHPAAMLGKKAWFNCKHCDSWAEMADADGDDGGLVPGAVHKVIHA